MKRRLRVVLGVVMVLTLSACGHDVNPDAWRQDLENLGVTNPDMDALEDLFVNKICKQDDDELSLFVAQAMDNGTDLDQLRVHFRNACPDSLEDLEAAVADVRGAGADADEACDTPASERTHDQELLAEAMGCD